MPGDELRYEHLVENALRGVVREALAIAARCGLHGEHHFYITFKTGAPGVNLANRLRAQHPDEMTIVLQHQFWDLTVDDEAFAVTLSFSGMSERLHIPFAAITAFADPSAKFGLQFQTVAVDADADAEEVEAPEPEAAAPAPAVDPAAKVVALDAFRKK